MPVAQVTSQFCRYCEHMWYRIDVVKKIMSDANYVVEKGANAAYFKVQFHL
jgi:hypothetical protein